MTSPITGIPSNIPVSLTTNQNTRPVSVRTAQENEIDQLNNTPNAKKLYNAKIIGGAIGGALPLGVAAWAFVSAKNNWKNTDNKAANKTKALIKAAVGTACLVFVPKMIDMGKSLSKNLTVFFSTRGKSPTEKAN
jgi:hypothetical protein